MRREVPKTFSEVMKLQKELDAKIHNIRPRTIIDILMSMNAELVEFNEASKGSHKTWKSKPFNQQDFEEEGADVLFLAAQLANLLDDVAGLKTISDFWSPAISAQLEKLPEDAARLKYSPDAWSVAFEDGFDSEEVRFSKAMDAYLHVPEELIQLMAIHAMTKEVGNLYGPAIENWDIVAFLGNLAGMYARVDYGKETLFQRYFEKWEKNFKRIGTEWNGPEKSEEE